MSGWCLGFLFSLGLASLFLWLTLRPSAPSLFINDLSLSNITLAFQRCLKNGNKDKGVYYDNITLSFFFPANSPRSLGPDVTLPAFYQGHGKKANRYDSLPADRGSLPIGMAAEFEVKLETRVRYKIWVQDGQAREAAWGGAGGRAREEGVELPLAGTPRLAALIFTAILWIGF